MGTPGAELIDGLPSVTDYDFFVWKGIEPDMHPYGACFHDLSNTKSTGVIEWLRASGVNTVVCGGLATDYCVKNTVLQLVDAGFEVLLYLPGCRGIASDTCESALKEMGDKGVTLVQSKEELISIVSN
eukprot:TRINITY_DN1952_c0_g1_i2.p1 TRINITY_DN1952_c0_g1~~TRINITY_DN1952_c0_g1_i2.p1  ORF type:complete len:128 (-),score=32.93 TRINITY_DN1952_c0_g1_i2:51-434(-)